VTGPLSVLVVDDVPDAADSTAILLGLRGFAVCRATDGPAALAAAADARPDVVVTDLRMPKMTGWELARRLAELYPDRPPAVVAVTGSTAADDFRRSEEVGIAAHLIKPVDPDELVAVIERCRPHPRS